MTYTFDMDSNMYLLIPVDLPKSNTTASDETVEMHKILPIFGGGLGRVLLTTEVNFDCQPKR